MIKKCFLVYPCGKKFELRVPIATVINGDPKIIIPGSNEYFEHAKQKFQIQTLRVIEEEIPEAPTPVSTPGFISLTRKKKSID